MTTLSSQTAGSKSFTRDLTTLRDQMAAITYVLKEAGLPFNKNNGVGHTDFSRIQGTGGTESNY